ncbi:MAG: cytochrome c-type biogenesis protein [Candidatus Azotimanducaceae bacterium]|jgi:cytochrome c-type biogenesis protein|tara:strand:- start:174 stop:1031 length:858 start_codon:yes stop_codon:yes gene_type:complete
MSLSFIRGLVAAVNPCGFILLPTYLMYFLGVSGGAPGTQKASLRRALKVSAAVSTGFLTVFLIIGFLSVPLRSTISSNSKYVTGFIAVALIVLGAAMLFGYKPPFMTPQIDSGKKDQTVTSMFVYGVAYAVASIGCTIGLFLATVFSARPDETFIDSVGNMVAYGAGMALLVSALTVGFAFANTSLLKFLRNSMQYIDRVAAAFVVLSGLYLAWYFYWVDLDNGGDPITDWAFARQADATAFLNDNWKVVGIVLVATVTAAVAYVTFRNEDEPKIEAPAESESVS